MVLGVVVGVSVIFVVLCRIAAKRHANDPIVMPFRTGNVGALGEAPPSPHHRLGARNP